MKKVAVVCALAFVVASVFSAGRDAEARPQYLKAFAGKYDKVADKAKDAKCGVCHPAKSKKVKNDYGTALGKSLTMKNQKEDLEAALDKAGKMKNADGKAFADIIDGGELPGTAKDE